MSTCRLLIHAAAAISLYLPVVHAQANFPFRLQLQQGQSTVTIPNNASVQVTGAIGQDSPITLTITYTGKTSATISTPQIFGSTDFSVVPLSTSPVTLSPNSSLAVTIQFKPSAAQTSTAQINVPWTEAPSASGQTGASGTIAVSFTSLASNLSVYYVLPTNNNVVPLPPGGTIQFPPTTVGGSITATVVIANSGSTQGVVNSVSVSGDAFQLVQLPLLPNGVNSGSTLTFGIKYTPTRLSSDTGSVTIVLGDRTFTANLSGSGNNAIYSYSTVIDGQSAPVQPTGAIAFPDTAVGQTSTVVLQIQNTGNATGTIPSIAISGAGFRITQAPPFPLMLQANGAAQVTLSFTPTQPGPLTGRLLIGSDYFDLTGNGLGTTLTFSYTTNGVVNSIQPSGAIPFTPTPVGLSSTIDFTVDNQGTAAAQIVSIGIGGSSASVFHLSNTPSLPAMLNPGQSITFTVTFTPASASQATANLLVNTQSFSLVGFGSDPPALPSYQITGLSGQVDPYSQPAVTLALAQPYAVDLHGTLAITGDSALAALDPAVQFSSGGRSVSFRIPAGQTQAVFSNGLTRVQLQTGTIAGTITLTPIFMTDAGIDVTPLNPQTSTATVPRQAPALLTAQVTSKSATSFTVVVTGYSTTRSLSALDFQFTGSTGVNLSGAHATVSLSQPAGAWFSSPGSSAFGGLFSVTTVFTLQSSDNNTSPIDKLQSFSVTATNDVSASSALTVPLQ